MKPSDVQGIADNIADFIELPDGIARLRKAVLTLAVSGMLVPQDEKEGTAEELYTEMQRERATAGEGSRKRTQKPLPPITDDEVPFEIPKSWKWVRLGDVGEIRGGKRLPKGFGFASERTKHPYIRITDMKGGTVIVQDIHYISDEVFSYISRYTISSQDIYITIAGTIGEVGRVPDELSGANLTENAAKFVFKHINVDYLIAIIKSDPVQSQFLEKIVQMAQPKLALHRIESSLVPLPPLAEQKRIAAKVEEVMKELDILEAKKKERDAVRTLLTKSAAHDLGTEGKTLLLEHLTELVRTPADVKELEGALLTLAVSGKLVPQDQKEGTAEELCAEIQKERATTGEGSRKRIQEALPPITDEEVPFEIPKSWKWVRLGEIFLIERGGSPRPIDSFLTHEPSGLNWIKIGDTEKGGKYIYTTKEKILPSGLKKSRMVHAGDLLLTNSMSFGRPYILKTDGCIHDGWLVLHPYFDEVDRDLFYYSLSSSFFSQQFAGLVSGAVVKNLNADKVKSAMVPLPPLAEQKRIVAKVEEVMGLISSLRNTIAS